MVFISLITTANIVMINTMKIIKKIKIIKTTNTINNIKTIIHLNSQNRRLKFSLELCCVAKLWVLSVNIMIMMVWR